MDRPDPAKAFPLWHPAAAHVAHDGDRAAWLQIHTVLDTVAAPDDDNNWLVITATGSVGLASPVRRRIRGHGTPRRAPAAGRVARRHAAAGTPPSAGRSLDQRDITDMLPTRPPRPSGAQPPLQCNPGATDPLQPGWSWQLGMLCVELRNSTMQLLRDWPGAPDNRLSCRCEEEGPHIWQEAAVAAVHTPSGAHTSQVHSSCCRSQQAA